MTEECVSQAPPYCVQIEFTEGCNLACVFCGINGIREKSGGPYRFLTPQIADVLARRLSVAGWNSRVEFAMHGEPTMNPDYIAVVRIFRRALPHNYFLMETNGAGLLRRPGVSANIKALFGAGLNVLAVEDYKGLRVVDRVRTEYSGAVVDYPNVLSANPHRRRRSNEHEVVVIADIAAANIGTHANLSNHTGCGAPRNSRGLGKRCAKPFRELSVRWDGSVAICCNDWRGYFKVGNVPATDLETLWHNRALLAARRKLYYGDRDFGPCAGCDALSYRVGLLPDTTGKGWLRRADAGDDAAIAASLAGPPLSAPVLRPWETR